MIITTSGRRAAYWAATVLVTAELVVGGAWDVLRIPQVSGVIEHLGYPSYVLVILGVWKMLGAVALLAARFPLVKEWAYAGVIFTDTGAIASHLTVGYGIGELAFLIPLLGLTVLSWSLRPPSRRVPRQAAPAGRDHVLTYAQRSGYGAETRCGHGVRERPRGRAEYGPA